MWTDAHADFYGALIAYAMFFALVCVAVGIVRHVVHNARWWWCGRPRRLRH